jgi:hypothetical protein
VKKTRQNKRLEPGSDSIRTDKALGTVCEPNPDKVMTQPYLGREAVSFSSILRDELTGRAAAAG